MLETLARVAPGTPLRDGLDRVLQANTGGLVVMGTGPHVDAICSGGFLIEAQLTPQRLMELCKMDGAVVLDEMGEFIVRANVHLVPDANILTTETGTRHRSAERVARQTGVAVLSVSKRLSLISVYRGDEKHILEPVERVLGRANQASSTLERYRARFDAVSASLSALEVEDLVTARDVLLVLQRGEMVRRIGEEAHVLLAELGTEGRLLRLQLEELSTGVDTELAFVLRDYAAPDRDPEEAFDLLCRVPTESLSDLAPLARVIGIPSSGVDVAMTTRGFRFLSRIPRLSDSLIRRIVDRFGSLQKILNASIGELEEIEGVGEVRALQIKEGLARLAESSILDRYG
ncbi:MAG: DNA integrity scanning protein DisA [Acidimicrobiia bacterium]|nr:DNA integrity scanning protein DisA [Acidimicrobiia bacterium]